MSEPDFAKILNDYAADVGLTPGTAFSAAMDYCRGLISDGGEIESQDIKLIFISYYSGFSHCQDKVLAKS